MIAIRSHSRSASSIRCVVTSSVVPASSRNGSRCSRRSGARSGRGRLSARRGTAPRPRSTARSRSRAPHHAARQRPRESVEERAEVHRLDRVGDALPALAPGHSRHPAVELEVLGGGAGRRRSRSPAARSRWPAARASPSETTSWPATEARPSAGGSSVVSTRIVVVFPGPVWPEQAEGLARADRERDAVDRGDLVEADDEAVDEDGGLGVEARCDAQRETRFLT